MILRVSHVLCLGELMTFDEINDDSESRKFIVAESILPNHFQSLNCRFITFPFSTSKMSPKLPTKRKKPEMAKKYYFIAAAKTLRTNLSSWYLNFFVETKRKPPERERIGRSKAEKDVTKEIIKRPLFFVSIYILRTMSGWRVEVEDDDGKNMEKNRKAFARTTFALLFVIAATVAVTAAATSFSLRRYFHAQQRLFLFHDFHGRNPYKWDLRRN